MKKVELPHNFEAEQAVLGALLVNNEIIHKLGLLPEHFYFEFHGYLFETMEQKIAAGEVASAVTLKPYFENEPALISHGGSAYLLRLADAAVTVFNVASYARLVVSLYSRRMLICALRDIEDRVIHDKGEVGDLLQDAEAVLYSVADAAKVSTNAPQRFEQVLDASLKGIKEAYDADGSIGLTWGVPSLDTAFGKFAPGEVTVIAGRPAMGKTAVSGSIALTNALAGEGVLFESLEMPARELGLRATSDALRRENKALAYSLARNGFNGSEAAFKEWVLHARDIRNLPLLINDTPGKTLAMVRSSMVRARNMLNGQGHELKMVIVDYIQLLESGIRSGNRAEEISQITRKLKELAKEFNVSIVALSQLSRRVEERDDKRPMLSDLRDSGSIEQDADKVVFLFREEYYLQGAEPKGGGTKAAEKLADWHAALDASKNKLELVAAKMRMGRATSQKVGCVLGCNYIHDLQEEGFDE